jgi:predicted nucleic acid-binding protein
MGSPTCLTDPEALVVVDASCVINLNATRWVQEIVRALPNSVVVVDAVSAELEEGRRRGRKDADLLNQLVADGLIRVVTLNDLAVKYFEELVIGSATKTLDDDEASTIGYCVAHEAIALVDERKANRICAEQFPKLRLACTMDIFTHPEVLRRLGGKKLADAVFNALCLGRMRVLPQHVDWIVGLIGSDRAVLCTSLPSSVRTRISKEATSRAEKR